jgi:hypothetical protein
MTATQQSIADIQNGQAELSEYAEKMQQRAQQPQQQQPQYRDVHDMIDRGFPDLRDDERKWLHEHPDAITGPGNMQRLDLAYRDAGARGIQRGSPEYFDFFNDRLGYELKDYRREPSDPVSQILESTREERPQRGQKLREVTLSKEQRDAARFSGVSEEEYARGVRDLEYLKRNYNMYNEES